MPVRKLCKSTNGSWMIVLPSPYIEILGAVAGEKLNIGFKDEKIIISKNQPQPLRI